MGALCKGHGDSTVNPAEVSWAQPCCFCLIINNADPAATGFILTYYVSELLDLKGHETLDAAYDREDVPLILGHRGQKET